MRSAPGPTTPLADGAEVLFEEAHRRRRRRRQLVAAAILVPLVLGAIIYLLVNGGGGGGSRAVTGPGGSGARGGAAGVSSSSQGTSTLVALPVGYWFDQIVTSDGRLFLTGYVATAANLTTFSRCAIAPVNPRTLAVGKATEGGCADPAMSARTVAPVISYPTTGRGTVAVARLHTKTGKVSTGPVVMTFVNSSDTRPITTYGGGSLWIYDVDTSRGAEALEVSATSGRVERAVSTPALVDPLIAANQNGLWLGNSVRGTPLPDALYHTRAEATKAQGVLSGAHGHVYWLTASGTHAWAGIGTSAAKQTIWRFEGAAARVGLRAREAGFDPAGVVVGDEESGLWTAVPYPPIGEQVTPSANKHEDVIRIDASTGREQVMAQRSPLPTLLAEEGLAEGEATVFDGSFFVLEPPFREYNYLGFTSLVRVTP